MTAVVLDANVAIAILSSDDTPELAFPGRRIIVPALFHPEVRSSLHRSVQFGVLEPADGRGLAERFEQWSLVVEEAPDHARRVWAIGDELGWGKTYDAEYLAVAQAASAPIASLDRRLLAGARQLGIVIDGSVS